MGRGRRGGGHIGATLGFVLGVSSALAGASPEQNCLDLVELVTEDMGEDQSLLARLRDRLARAAELCRSGRSEEAEALLRELQGEWLPMGPGN